MLLTQYPTIKPDASSMAKSTHISPDTDFFNGSNFLFSKSSAYNGL